LVSQDFQTLDAGTATLAALNPNAPVTDVPVTVTNPFDFSNTNAGDLMSTWSLNQEMFNSTPMENNGSFSSDTNMTPGSEALSPDLSGPPQQFDPNYAPAPQQFNDNTNLPSDVGYAQATDQGQAVQNDSLPAFTDPGTTTPTNDGFNPTTNDGSGSSYPTSVNTNDGSSSSYPTNVGSYPTNAGSYPNNVGSYPTNTGSYPTNTGSYPGSSGGGGYGGFGGYGGGGYGGGGYGGGGYYPIVLDLTGKGMNIRQLSSSNTFFDMAGDGHQNLTAWAGAGNGVLFYDPTGTGQLTQANQIIFTVRARQQTIVRSHQFRKWPITIPSGLAAPSAPGSDRNNFRRVTQMGGGGWDAEGYGRCIRRADMSARRKDIERGEVKG